MMRNPAAADDSVRRHFIPEWAAKAGKTRGDIIEFTGADKSLVSRWFDGTLPNGKYLSALADLFGIKAVDLFIDPRLKDRQFSEALSVEAQMPVEGYVAASTWQEADGLAQGPDDWIPAARDPAYASGRQYAIEVRGNSMDRLVKSGEYVVVVEAGPQSPRDGDVVVVRRVRGHLIERTLKIYRETAKGGALLPDSTDQKHEPIPVDDHSDTVIEIEAYAIGKWSRIGRR